MMKASQREEMRLTLAGHLEELRRRLGISLAALLIAVAVAWTQVDRLLDVLLQPAQPWIPRLAFFSPTEPFTAYLHIATLAGLAVAMPVLLWQVWEFIRLGLSRQERVWGTTFIVAGSGLFVAGVAFAYAVVLPLSLRVLLGIGRIALEPVLSIQQYVSFVTSLLFWCGVLFELPMLLWLLAKVGVVSAEWLRQQRPYAILILVILAAVLTPTTDLVSLTLMTIPLLLLYELSILIARPLQR
jgi:sec-independent protein translocase protein TatC